MSGRPRVVVVGGGLAGLAAAIGCLDGGAAVTLLEARPRLGGATWSFTRNGLSFDNGQHVFLRCCTAYQRFLERIGTAHLAPLQDRLSIPVLRPAGATGEPELSWLRRDPLPAPLHLARSLAGYRHLGLGDRLRLGRAALALRRLRPDDPSLDEQSFADFLARHSQSEAAVRSLWELISLPTTNVRAEQCSLALAAKVFRTGLLTQAAAADVGWARVPLSRLHAEPAEQLLTRAGAVVRRRARVDSVARSARDVPSSAGSGAPGPAAAPLAAGVYCDGELVDADAVVLAVPHTAVASLLPPAALGEGPLPSGLGCSPIVDVNVVFDRRVMPFALAAGVGTPVQFVFDRTESAGLDPAAGQCLAVSVSAADAELGERPQVLIDRYLAALRELFPAARQAGVLDAVVTREHEATFRGLPGSAGLRRGSATAYANVFLAGAWTDTGWPATMEGAVRSGNTAAAGVLALLARRRLSPGAAPAAGVACATAPAAGDGATTGPARPAGGAPVGGSSTVGASASGASSIGAAVGGTLR